MPVAVELVATPFVVGVIVNPPPKPPPLELVKPELDEFEELVGKPVLALAAVDPCGPEDALKAIGPPPVPFFPGVVVGASRESVQAATITTASVMTKGLFRMRRARCNRRARGRASIGSPT